MPFKDNEFNIVLGDLVLGNISGKDLNKFLKEVNRVLTPNGDWIQRLFYVPSKLKYERKITIRTNKKYSYTFKISDIHFEIDMDLLGCNARVLWNEIYKQISQSSNS